MIYVDTSVALARIFAEQRRPDPSFWDQPMASSRLLNYEIWNRLHAVRRGDELAGEAGRVLQAVELLDLSPIVLARALKPFPVPVRTLDGLHLATADFLRGFGRPIAVASYDIRMNEASAAMGFAIAAF